MSTSGAGDRVDANAHESDSFEGRWIVRGSWWSTLAFSITAIAAALSPGFLRWPALVVALAMFGSGCVVFLWAFAIAVGRSRTDAIGIGGLFFLAGSAPTRVRAHLMGSVALQIVVGLATASLRIFTTLAFGALAPMLGLAMAGLWGAKFGIFGVRSPSD